MTPDDGLRSPVEPPDECPSLSVLVPAWNAERYLPETLDSLLGQGVADMEVVVCDDGSTDDTAAIVRARSAEDCRVRLVTQPNAGAGTARNLAFANARGAWVIFFDADDLLAPRSLLPMLALARSHPGDVVHCPWSKLGDPDAASARRDSLASDMDGPGWMQRAFLTDYPTYTGTFLLPRALVETAGGWNPRLSFQDDLEFYARVLCRAPSVRHCGEARFPYRQGVPGSVSNRGGRRHMESQLMATTLGARHLLAARDQPASRRAAHRQLMLACYSLYRWAPDLSAEAERVATEVARGRRWRPWLPGGPGRRVLQIAVGWKAALRVHAFLGHFRR